ncbi:cytidyltransferase [Methanocaldococcus villosus KIN24-T80]|uniref:Cytidyltransferase n=1 Tax=Methanocaldococcus villosus KIN24-T80 TaxID=1069083 RepID=N6UWB8_9EURY|nr:nucleotidyltransferase family protein [Methanocaldococcus villosus]ENN96599.1 cytidyltransferase [Methanocaldococcus villosus KIN24-T80]
MYLHLQNFLNDRLKVIDDAEYKNKESFKRVKEIIEEIKDVEGKDKVVCDFTEYNPLHKGHKYALEEGKKYGIFVSVLPGPLERSGRGVPYLFDRYIRARMAIEAGADLVVEGPAMGILGSGQYMRCLIKMFYCLGADYIVRGYIPEPTIEKVIEKINKGYHIRVKPYKIICIESGEVLGEKLEIDNYVIASMSQTIYKLNEEEKLNFNPKFIFVRRLEGISGTKIREAVLKGRFDSVKDMLPESTLKILEDLKSVGLERFILRRFDDLILRTANYDELIKYLPERLAKHIENNRPYHSVNEIKAILPNGFSKHVKERVISILEARISKEIRKKYVSNYPAEIRILGISKRIS